MYYSVKINGRKYKGTYQDGRLVQIEHQGLYLGRDRVEDLLEAFGQLLGMEVEGDIDKGPRGPERPRREQ